MDSKSKIVLLERLLGRPFAFSVSDLARLAGLPKATVSVIVKDWEEAGLVKTEQQGRNKLVRINQGFYLQPELKRIFSKASNFQEPLLEKLKAMPLGNPGIKAVVVFGSRARNNFSQKSDLDVLVVLKDKDSKIAEKIAEEFSKASSKTGVMFSPTLLSSAETRSRWIEKDQFLQNILKEGKILKGRTWLEHLQATP